MTDVDLETALGGEPRGQRSEQFRVELVDRAAGAADEVDMLVLAGRMVRRAP